MKHRYLMTAIVFALPLLLGVPSPAQIPAEVSPEILLRWDGHEMPYHEFEPQDVAVDRWGVVYVSDSREDRVLKFQADGTYLGEWGGPGSADGEFNRPLGIAVDPTGYHVFVVDSDNQRVQVFTDDGSHVASLTTAYHNPPSLPVGFDEPHDVFVDAEGYFYVTDKALHTVTRYQPDLDYDDTWGGYGNNPGEFDQPRGVTVDGLGRIWVADSINERLQVFTNTGSYLFEWAQGPEFNIDRPYDLVIDPLGQVYVVNDRSRLLKFGRYGEFLSETSLFDMPEGVALYGNGTCFVANTMRSEILKLGYPPQVTAIADVPDDQGRWVRLFWDASVLDRPDAVALVTGYTVYRRLDAASSRPPHPLGSNAISQETAKGLEGWDVLGAVPARGDSTYQFVVPTLCDSTAGGICWSVFVVSAFTEFGEFHDSTPDSGYSTDDIPPPVPGGLLVSEIPGNLELELEWGPSSAPDIAWYGVYRGSSPDFVVADPYTPYAATVAPGFSDENVSPGETWYYRVAAFDDADGFAGFSVAECATVLSAVEDPLPLAFRLLQNTPNPFNPTTVIGFDLPAACRVHLRIHDVGGRLIRCLLNGEDWPAGHHEAAWNGRDDTGRSLAAGLYFYRLEADGFTEIRRMMLVR
ncbi:MAG: FlgD immunoglobulin-like domain containing protein [bacterium]